MEEDDEEEDEEDMEAIDAKGVIMESVKKSNRKKTERDMEKELGDDYGIDFNKRFDLADPEQKYDVIPEHWQGHNIADYIDPDIMAKLEALEKEEETREKAGFYDPEEEVEDDNMKEIRSLATRIRTKKKLLKNDQRIDNTRNKPVMPRTADAVKRDRSVSRLKKEFTELGVDMDGTEKDTNFATMPNKRRSRSISRANSEAKKAKMDSSMEVKRSLSRDVSGVRDPKTRMALRLHEKKMQKKKFAKWGKTGESDRHIAEKKPKHLFSGKRGAGKTDRR